VAIRAAPTMAVGVWLVWDLWSATAPTPITDDFLKLLEDSFARDWQAAMAELAALEKIPW